MPATLALDDGAAAHFVGHDLLRVVSTRSGAAGYRIELKDETATETRLPVEQLPADSPTGK
jgi:hypothetical protein